MPTDTIDLSFAAASILCVMLARSDAFDVFDGLGARQRATTLGSATVIVATLACVLTQWIAVVLDLSSAQLLPLIALALCVAIIHIASAISRHAFRPLHHLLQQLAPQLLPATLLSASVSMLIAPPLSPLHAALNASLCALVLAILLHVSLALHKSITAVPQLNALPKHSLRFHALSLALAGIVAAVGGVVLEHW